MLNRIIMVIKGWLGRLLIKRTPLFSIYLLIDFFFGGGGEGGISVTSNTATYYQSDDISIHRSIDPLIYRLDCQEPLDFSTQKSKRSEREARARRGRGREASERKIFFSLSAPHPLASSVLRWRPVFQSFSPRAH